ncbi:MAG: acyltransferase family protein [Pseudomonas sp.]
MTSLKLEDVPDHVINPIHIKYRSDIDGLRAIAVLSVVLFHAFPSLIRGGFIGVDIFFVISGFLITSILIKNSKKEIFSISEFYARRITRIFPALIVVLITSLTLGWITLLADEYMLLGKHTLAGIGFVSNLVFWSESSYFETAAETKPLLHLWSLGIEEQFYLVWPLVLWACWKKRSSILGAILVIGAVSFALNLYEAVNNPIADFYSPYTRFWELLAGALVASILNERQAALPQGRLADALSCLGAILIIAGLAFISRAATFPGMFALLPVLGTVLTISAGPKSIINRTVLSSRLLVWVGLISYPLYLWHWPLLSFARIIESETPSLYVRVMAVLMAIILAWATYLFVEMPLRTGQVKRSIAIPALIGIMASIGLAAWIVYANNGFSSRTGANPVEKFSNDLGRDPYLTYISNNFFRCSDVQLKELSYPDTVYGYRCFQSKPNSPVEMLLIGDSHAEHLLPGIAEQFKNINVGSFEQSELPSVDSPHFTKVLQLIADNKDIKTIVISALWFDKIKSGAMESEKQMLRTFKFLAHTNKKIYVLDDIPAFSFSPEKCKYGRRFSGSGTTCDAPLQEHLNQKKYYFDILTSTVKNFSNIKFIPVDQFFCDEKICKMTFEGTLLYRDTNHLNIDGSKYLAKMLIQAGAF